MEMSHQLVVICWMIWIIILAHQVAGRSTGPPSAACADITPEHSPDLPSTCTPPCPYSLQVTAINGVSVGPLTGSVEYSSSSDMFRSKLANTNSLKPPYNLSDDTITCLSLTCIIDKHEDSDCIIEGCTNEAFCSTTV